MCCVSLAGVPTRSDRFDVHVRAHTCLVPIICTYSNLLAQDKHFRHQCRSMSATALVPALSGCSGTGPRGSETPSRSLERSACSATDKVACDQADERCGPPAGPQESIGQRTTADAADDVRGAKRRRVGKVSDDVVPHFLPTSLAAEGLAGLQSFHGRVRMESVAGLFRRRYLCGCAK